MTSYKISRYLEGGLFTRRQIAEIVGVSLSTVSRYVKRGGGPTPKKVQIGDRIGRFFPEDSGNSRKKITRGSEGFVNYQHLEDFSNPTEEKYLAWEEVERRMDEHFRGR